MGNFDHLSKYPFLGNHQTHDAGAASFKGPGLRRLVLTKSLFYVICLTFIGENWDVSSVCDVAVAQEVQQGIF